jgi:hypothetical protein
MEIKFRLDYRDYLVTDVTAQEIEMLTSIFGRMKYVGTEHNKATDRYELTIKQQQGSASVIEVKTQFELFTPQPPQPEQAGEE